MSKTPNAQRLIEAARNVLKDLELNHQGRKEGVALLHEKLMVEFLKEQEVLTTENKDKETINVKHNREAPPAKKKKSKTKASSSESYTKR